MFICMAYFLLVSAVSSRNFHSQGSVTFQFGWLRG